MANETKEYLDYEGLTEYHSKTNDMTTGINLLRGTRDFRIGSDVVSLPISTTLRSDGFYYTLSDKRSTYLDKDGFIVIKLMQDERSAYDWNNVISSAIYGAKKGDVYTASFDMMIDDTSKFQQTSLNIFAYNMWNGTQFQNTTVNLIDKGIKFSDFKSGEWHKVSFQFTIDKDVDETGLFQVVIQIGRGGSLNIRKIMLQRGVINNPIWSPSPFDVNYINDMTTGMNLLRGTRDFNYELVSAVAGGNRDKWQYISNPIVSFYKDTDGFTVFSLDCTSDTGTNNRRGNLYSSTFPYDKKVKTYTVSLQFMVEDVSEWTDKDRAIMHFAFRNNSGASTVSSLLSTKNTVDGEVDIVSGEWTQLVWHVTLSENSSSVYGDINLFIQGNGHINFKGVMVQPMKVNNPIYSVAPADLSLEPINDYTTGINLVRGAKDFRIGSEAAVSGLNPKKDGWYQSNYVERLTDQDGFTVIHISSTNQNTDLFRYVTSSAVYGLSKGDKLTISFDMKVDDFSAYDNKYMLVVHFRDKDGTAKKTSNIATTMLEYDQALRSGDWVQIKYVYEVTNDSEPGDFLTFNLQMVRNGSIYFRKPMIQIGEINKPIWSQSPFDIDYINDETTGMNLLRGTRDFVQGSKSTKHNAYFDDGFKYPDSAHYRITQDENGINIFNIFQSGVTANAYRQLVTPVFYGLKPKEFYTIAFDFMVDDVEAWDAKSTGAIRQTTLSNEIVVNRGFSNSIYDPDTKFPVSVNDMKSKKWYKVITFLDCAGDDGKEYAGYAFWSLDKNGSINIKNVCVYKGRINNSVWSANPFDVASVEVQDGKPLLLGIVPNSNKIQANSDLNEYVAPDVYYVESNSDFTTLKNRPDGINSAGKLIVEYTTGKGPEKTYYYVRQKYVTYNDLAMEFIRFKAYNEDWTSWRQTYANTTIRPYEGGGTNANSLSGAKANLGITAIENNLNRINDETTGTNLLRGTMDFSTGSSHSVHLPTFFSDNGFTYTNTVEIKKDQDGYGVFGSLKTGPSTMVYSSAVKDLKIGDIYTFTVDYFIEERPTKPTYFGFISVYDKTATSPTVGRKINQDINTSDLGTDIGVWKTYKTYFRITNAVDDSDDSLFMAVALRSFVNDPNGMGQYYIKFRKPLLYKGYINNPIWSPNPLDITRINDCTTGINLLRGTRDFVEGTQAVPDVANSLKYDGVVYSNTNWKIIKPGSSNEFGIAERLITGSSSHLYFNPVFGSEISRSPFTLSCEVMYTEKPASDIGIMQVLQFDQGGKGSYESVNITVKDSGYTFDTIPLNEWVTVSKVYESYDIPEGGYLRIGLIGSGTDAKHYVRKPRLVKGRINHSIWSANPFDMMPSSFNDESLLEAQRNLKIFEYKKHLGTLTTDTREYWGETPSGWYFVNGLNGQANWGWLLHLRVYDSNQSTEREKWNIKQVLLENGGVLRFRINDANNQTGNMETFDRVFTSRASIPVESGGTGNNYGGASRLVNNAITTGTDLNDLCTSGYYLLTKSSDLETLGHAPSGSAFGLSVFGILGTAEPHNYLGQLACAYFGGSLSDGVPRIGKLSYRTKSFDSVNMQSKTKGWSQWAEIYSSESRIPYNSGIYNGVDLAVKFKEEIGDSPVPNWISSRVSQGQFEGIHIGDYVDIDCSGVIRRYVVADIDPWYKIGWKTYSIKSHHLVMVPSKVWELSTSLDGSGIDTSADSGYAVGRPMVYIKWNKTSTNNGISGNTVPYMASNLHKWEKEVAITQFPQEWQDVMIDRVVYNEVRYSASSELTDPNGWTWSNLGKLWSLSEVDLYGSASDGSFERGTDSQLAIFRKTSFLASILADSNDASIWLRTPARNDSKKICAVAYGYPTTIDAASGTTFPYPCFLIG